MAKTKNKKKKKKAAADSSRTDPSVQAFRDALEKSVTISRERLQEVADDAVKRGRMTRGDAEEFVGRLVTRGRDQSKDLLAQLDRVLAQVREVPDRARSEIDSRTKGVRKRAVKTVDRPLEQADIVRRRARVPGFPITAYDQLTAKQIDRRLQDLTRTQLRKVKSYEQKNKARKGLLRTIDRKLQV
jgi:polyhydroxyalkanoate synthesis regulator phasin